MPSLNISQAGAIGTGRLVRFRGLVQDMEGMETYLLRYRADGVVHCCKYRDAVCEEVCAGRTGSTTVELLIGVCVWFPSAVIALKSTPS